MLLQFSCSNFRSIKDTITFSMRSLNDSSPLKRVVLFEGINFERISVIYGANGSGKSNFISAVDFARFIVTHCLSFQPGQLINACPHKLLGPTSPSVFSFHFEIHNVRYVYSFSVKNSIIDEEYLYFFPNGRKTKIFSRKGLHITPGSKYKHSFALSLNVLQDNRLFLSCAANYSRAEEIKNAFIFFSDNLVIYKVHIDSPRTNNWYEYSVQTMQNNPAIKSMFLKFLHLLDTGIRDVSTEMKKFSVKDFDENMPESVKDFLKNSVTLQASIIYEHFETDLMTEESTGIQKLFQMICPILDILMKGKVLFCDEIETGLHEAVVHKIIELFYELYPDKKAQMIFTTHDTSLLDAKLFLRGQIWFTQLTKERATDLYSLAEIRHVRKDENLARGYISGKYGAIPILNQNFMLSEDKDADHA